MSYTVPNGSIATRQRENTCCTRKKFKLAFRGWSTFYLCKTQARAARRAGVLLFGSALMSMLPILEHKPDMQTTHIWGIAYASHPFGRTLLIKFVPMVQAVSPQLFCCMTTSSFAACCAHFGYLVGAWTMDVVILFVHGNNRVFLSLGTITYMHVIMVTGSSRGCSIFMIGTERTAVPLRDISSSYMECTHSCHARWRYLHMTEIQCKHSIRKATTPNSVMFILCINALSHRPCYITIMNLAIVFGTSI